jgi:hypothetical protein
MADPNIGDGSPTPIPGKKNAPANLGARRTPSSPGADGIIKSLLGFLDRHMTDFSPRVRDAIGITMTLVVATYVLNGLFAQTYIQGEIRELSSDGTRPVGGWVVSNGNTTTISNELGWWTLPVARGGIPQRIRIELRTENKVYVDDYSIYGPWPIWNAFFPMVYLFDVDRTKKPGGRIKGRLALQHESATAPTVYAQDQRQQPASVPGDAVVLELKGVRVDSKNTSSGFLRGVARVYFGFSLDGQAVNDDVVTPSTRFLFPVKSNRESWLPLSQGYSSGKLQDNSADIRTFFAVSKNADGSTTVKSGTAELRLFSDSGDLLGVFDLARLFAARPDTVVTLSSSKPYAEVDLLCHGLPESRKSQSICPSDRPLNLQIRDGHNLDAGGSNVVIYLASVSPGDEADIYVVRSQDPPWNLGGRLAERDFRNALGKLKPAANELTPDSYRREKLHREEHPKDHDRSSFEVSIGKSITLKVAVNKTHYFQHYAELLLTATCR